MNQHYTRDGDNRGSSTNSTRTRPLVATLDYSTGRWALATQYFGFDIISADLFTLLSMESITPILEETLEPPTTAAKGLLGSATAPCTGREKRQQTDVANRETGEQQGKMRMEDGRRGHRSTMYATETGERRPRRRCTTTLLCLLTKKHFSVCLCGVIPHEGDLKLATISARISLVADDLYFRYFVLPYCHRGAFLLATSASTFSSRRSSVTTGYSQFYPWETGRLES